jgi:hypothetical protein
VSPYHRGLAVALMVAGAVVAVVGVGAVAVSSRHPVDAGVIAAPGTTPHSRAPTPGGGSAPASAGPLPDGPAPPVRLEIPALAVSAPVVDAPTMASGELLVPADPGQVGWWVGGAAAGAPTGTLLLAGHADNPFVTGALFRLKDLPMGAVVYVASDVQRYTYRITARRAYPRSHLPATLFERDGPPRLALVTCGGAFQHGRYEDNIVVYAEPVTA